MEHPYYELDNVVWERHNSGDRRRTEKEREEYLRELLQSEEWIVEGVHNESWVAESFHKADLVIFLDTKYSVRTYRIIKRFIFQKLCLEKSNYKPTIKIFFKMFKWNKQFEEGGKPNFFNVYADLQNKVFIARTNRCINRFFKDSTSAVN
ncbi:DNA topology modulation protein FlaR [Halobacillus dabanensis]|uniref:DNA topology modulation protein FlaR n=1 Tax=Halobacillus dabanensis TaxID=240302 RepID=UPI000AC3B088